LLNFLPIKKNKIIYIFTFLIFIFPQYSSANNEDILFQKVHQLLQEKKFTESIDILNELSQNNNIEAQLLYSKILFAGNIVPQDFNQSYFWANLALLGGLKKSSQLIEMLNNYLIEKQIEEIKENIKIFLEKRAFINDTRAIIQIAKFYETYMDPPDIFNSYSWYSVAVAKGIKSAVKKRDELLDQMDQKKILEAQELSNKIFKKIQN
jgi:hypothetical protein